MCVIWKICSTCIHRLVLSFRCNIQHKLSDWNLCKLGIKITFCSSQRFFLLSFADESFSSHMFYKSITSHLESLLCRLWPKRDTVWCSQSFFLDIEMYNWCKIISALGLWEVGEVRILRLLDNNTKAATWKYNYNLKTFVNILNFYLSKFWHLWIVK